jgi:hypothetical protein
MTDSDTGSKLIKCADCLHCKQFREVSPSTGRYALKVRCAKGHWQEGRKRGACDLFRVTARRTQKCRDYVSMSTDDEDRQRFLAGLAADLPRERILYEADGEPVDLTEVTSWTATDM